MNYSLLGSDLSFSTSDLLAFGLEKLYERFGEQKLDFHIQKLTGQLYKIYPANDLAALFFKNYSDEKELLVDLNTVDKYLDLLMKEDLLEINQAEQQLDHVDDAVVQILHDLDVVIKNSPPGLLDTPTKEQILVDEVLIKNKNLVDRSTKDRERRQRIPESAVDEILSDFPSTPYRAKTEQDEIDDILAKLGAGQSTAKKSRRGLKS